MFIPILREDGANLTCDLVHIFCNSPTTDAVCVETALLFVVDQNRFYGMLSNGYQIYQS